MQPTVAISRMNLQKLINASTCFYYYYQHHFCLLVFKLIGCSELFFILLNIYYDISDLNDKTWSVKHTPSVYFYINNVTKSMRKKQAAGRLLRGFFFFTSNKNCFSSSEPIIV